MMTGLLLSRYLTKAPDSGYRFQRFIVRIGKYGLMKGNSLPQLSPCLLALRPALPGTSGDG